MKTPEEMAEEWGRAWRYEGVCHFALGNLRLSEYAQNEVQRRLSSAFLAGYKAGREITDQEIVDIIVDIREREAKERSKRPAVQEDRHNKIWERIKLKVIGVLP